MEISQHSYRLEASRIISDIIQIDAIEYEYQNKNLSFVTGIGNKWLTQSVRTKMIPGGIEIQYEAAPRPIQTSHHGWLIKGTMGYRITLKKKPDQSWYKSFAIELEKGVKQSLSWVKHNAKALGLIIGGGLIITFTVAEDILTFGGGTLDDPATFMMGSAIIGTGIKEIKKTEE